MVSQLALQAPELMALSSPTRGIPWNSGVWAVTLWTEDRSPLFVTMLKSGVGLSPLGELVRQCWADLPRLHPNLTLDAFGVSPDRLRGLVHIPLERRAGLVGSIVGQFKSAVIRTAKKMGLVSQSKIWEPSFEGILVRGPEELEHWRRRIHLPERAGLTL